jgi:tetratricopeptide (TPR) repeat protein
MFMLRIIIILTINYLVTVAAYAQTSSGSLSAEELYSVGLRFFELNQYELSQEAYTDYIQLKPENHSAYFMRGQARENLEDYSGAMSDYNMVIALNPTDGLCFYLRARLKGKRNDYRGAIADCNTAIKFDCQDAGVYFIRGVSKIVVDEKEGGCLDLSKAGELGYEKAYEVIRELCY